MHFTITGLKYIVHHTRAFVIKWLITYEGSTRTTRHNFWWLCKVRSLSLTCYLNLYYWSQLLLNCKVINMSIEIILSLYFIQDFFPTNRVHTQVLSILGLKPSMNSGHGVVKTSRHQCTFAWITKLPASTSILWLRAREQLVYVVLKLSRMGSITGRLNWVLSLAHQSWLALEQRRALLQTNDFEFVDLIGRDDQSWGLSYKGKIWHNGQVQHYCEPFYDSTVIGVLLDMDAGTLSYFMNGRPLGVAFTGLCDKASELYPIISSTSTLSEIELCDSTCRYVSLQDQCRMTIAKLVNKDKIDFLPLPRGICQSLKGV